MSAYRVPFYFHYWPALMAWDQASLPDAVLAVGGLIATFCMGRAASSLLLRRIARPGSSSPWSGQLANAR